MRSLPHWPVIPLTLWAQFGDTVVISVTHWARFGDTVVILVTLWSRLGDAFVRFVTLWAQCLSAIIVDISQREHIGARCDFSVTLWAQRVIAQ